MGEQLSFFETKPKERKYLRAKDGKFATQEQIDIEAIKGEREYYKVMYEAEKRKNQPLHDNYVRLDRELQELKMKLRECLK